MTTRVHRFGRGVQATEGLTREVLGGKGYGLVEMTRLGIPVPPGFTITTEVCNAYYAQGALPADVVSDIARNLALVGKDVDATLGDARRPLLVSVRSGARASMPGMMDTVLNLGLNDVTVEALAVRTGNPRFAYDAYRRFITIYANVVLGASRERYEDSLARARARAHVRADHEIPAEIVRDHVRECLALAGPGLPQDPMEQLHAAIAAVFRSWHNDRAGVYRKMQGIPESWGTACTVQAMVFGNLGDASATGVAFTRDPSSGEPGLYGEFLPNAQGEDVVAGIRTGGKITARAAADAGASDALETRMPTVFAELAQAAGRLERHFRDAQDIEFTVQDGVLWLLQTRNAKRTARASVRIATDLVREGLIDRDEALLRVDAARLPDMFLPRLSHETAHEAEARGELLAQGLAASPGYAAGEIVFHADDAERLAGRGRDVILVRRETSPDDIHGMSAARGILTATGGLTSHAAVVARGMGKCCVAGCSALAVDYATETLRVTTATGTRSFRRGETLTLDGSTGRVYAGVLAVSPAVSDAHYDELMAWADARRTLGVRANADTPADARNARHFGAEGIGLCRTEHMFFEKGRIAAVREMILAGTEAERRRALDKIIPMQSEDFAGIFRAMDGLPVTVRLLDPPLHEFLPETPEDLAALATDMKVPVEVLRARNDGLREFNPMLGHRGCRLGLVYPEIYESQARALARAAVECAASGVDVRPEVMIPLVATAEELSRTRAMVIRATTEEFTAAGRTVAYTVGTMIELPRACIVAGEIAAHADFFSFGTNDLTQTTWGLSRDDAGRFLPVYIDGGIVPADPFATLDIVGVGALMRLAVAGGRAVKPEMKLGICGEHGGDPASVGFCDALGLTYVSCSPYRVPTARLAAAQATVKRARS